MCTARTLHMHVLMHMLMHMLMHVLMHMLLCICIYVVYAPHAYLPTTQADLRKLDEIIASCPGVGTICLDVANGYSEAFVATVKEVRGASCMCTACALHAHVQRSHCVRPACEVRACLLHVLHPACILHAAAFVARQVRGRHPTHTIIAGNVVRTCRLSTVQYMRA